jgi:hypothetical protein
MPRALPFPFYILWVFSCRTPISSRNDRSGVGILAWGPDGLETSLGERNSGRVPANGIRGRRIFMGLDNTVITVVGIIVAALGALVMAAAIAANERSASEASRRRTRGAAEPGSGPGLPGDRA